MIIDEQLASYSCAFVFIRGPKSKALSMINRALSFTQQ